MGDFHHEHHYREWIVGFVLWTRTSNVIERVLPHFFTICKEDESRKMELKIDVCILEHEESCSLRIQAASHNNKHRLVLCYHGKPETTDVFVQLELCFYCNMTTHKYEDSYMSGCARLWSVNSLLLQPRPRAQWFFWFRYVKKELRGTRFTSDDASKPTLST